MSTCLRRYQLTCRPSNFSSILQSVWAVFRSIARRARLDAMATTCLPLCSYTHNPYTLYTPVSIVLHVSESLSLSSKVNASRWHWGNVVDVFTIRIVFLLDWQSKNELRLSGEIEGLWNVLTIFLFTSKRLTWKDEQENLNSDSLCRICGCFWNSRNLPSVEWK